MKKLQIMAVSLLCMGVFIVGSSFKPEAGNDKKQVIQANYKPVLTTCLTPNGVTYAFRNTCVFSMNDVCVATTCPGAPVQANKQPVLVNCVKQGRIYAFANSCVNQVNSVCRPTACP